MTAPRIWVTPSWWRTSTSPRPPKARPSVANTSGEAEHEQHGAEQGPAPGGSRRARRAAPPARAAGRPRRIWPRAAPAGVALAAASTAHAGPVGRHCHPLGRGRLGPLRVGPGHAGHVGQVAGDQRQDAGRQEGETHRPPPRSGRPGSAARSGPGAGSRHSSARLLFAHQATASQPAAGYWPPSRGPLPRGTPGSTVRVSSAVGLRRSVCDRVRSCAATAGRWPADSSRRGRARAPPPCAERRSSWTMCPAGPSPVWPSGCGAGYDAPG